MPVAQNLYDRIIMESLHNNYDIEIVRLLPLPWGADQNALVFKAIAGDQTEYFVKLIKDAAVTHGAFVFNILQQAGIKNIAFPIETTAGNKTLHTEGFTIIVYPFIHGQNAFCQNLTLDQWKEMGRTLKQIHSLTVPTSLQEQIRLEDFSPHWRRSVRDFYQQPVNHRNANDIARTFMDFMEEKASTILRLIDRAEELAQQIHDQAHLYVLCHADLHGGNVLIDQSSNLYIIDWDNPIRAPKERDLMFIGGGVGNVWNQPQETAAFYEGYGKVEINRSLLTYYRYERIVEDIAEYSELLLLHNENPQQQEEAFKHFIAQFAPNGVVDIAFKTDEHLT